MPEEALPPGVPEGRKVRLAGRGTTWVRETGQPATPGRPTIMLLHGLTATAALNWAPSFPALAERYHVVALDHRGHGRGIRPSGLRGFRLRDCADDVAALADALEIDRFIACGYSMGGPIASLTWRRHPDRVSGLVLCATAGSFTRTLQPMLQWALAGGVSGVATAIRTVPRPVRRQVAAAGNEWRRRNLGFPAWALDETSRNDPAAIIEAARELQRFNSLPWLPDVDVPAAAVITVEDRVVPTYRQQRMAHAIPGCQTFPVVGDHAVCLMHPDRFVPALVAACDAVASARLTHA